MRRALALACTLFASPVLLEAQAAWTRIYPAQSPPARTNPLMECFEPLGQTVLLFGNAGPGVYRQDLWEWNGSAWTQRTPSPIPGARDRSLMSFDPATGKVLLTGGINSAFGGMFNETWTWDGTSWILLQPATPPLPHT